MTLALVDFGDTIADQMFMRRDCEGFPNWTATWVEVLDELRTEWDTGRLSSTELASEIARRSDSTTSAVRGYMAQLCRGITFFPAINNALRRRRRRGELQVLVTVNPDLITEIVGHYSLMDVFDDVVASSVHGTDDKVELCQRALAIMAVEDPADSILIDNVEFNVQGWTAAGGLGYTFISDEVFAADVLGDRVTGFVPNDVDQAGLTPG